MILEWFPVKNAGGGAGGKGSLLNIWWTRSCHSVRESQSGSTSIRALEKDQRSCSLGSLSSSGVDGFKQIRLTDCGETPQVIHKGDERSCRRDLWQEKTSRGKWQLGSLLRRRHKTLRYNFTSRTEVGSRTRWISPWFHVKNLARMPYKGCLCAAHPCDFRRLAHLSEFMRAGVRHCEGGVDYGNVVFRQRDTNRWLHGRRIIPSALERQSLTSRSFSFHVAVFLRPVNKYWNLFLPGIKRGMSPKDHTMLRCE